MRSSSEVFHKTLPRYIILIWKINAHRSMFISWGRIESKLSQVIIRCIDQRWMIWIADWYDCWNDMSTDWKCASSIVQGLFAYGSKKLEGSHWTILVPRVVERRVVMSATVGKCDRTSEKCSYCVQKEKKRRKKEVISNSWGWVYEESWYRKSRIIIGIIVNHIFREIIIIWICSVWGCGVTINYDKINYNPKVTEQ